LFLDEIGELPLPLQAQLLRVLQEGTFRRVGGNAWHRSRFRLVAATNRDLPAMVAAGAFRADLYWRLAGIELSLPALRDRPGDVLPLARHFLAELTNGAPPQLDPAVVAWLLDRTYPRQHPRAAPGRGPLAAALGPGRGR
jgi:transcriptional regulator with PAS, ATPase and Fis domain